MRYWEIIESTSLLELRRNPEQNPKVSTLEALEKYAGRDDVFISFTSDVGKMSHGFNGKNISGSKLGVNPKSSYNTPIGIYTYPIDYVISRKGRVPFAARAPLLYVVQSTKPLLDLNNYSESDFEMDSKKLIDMGFTDTRDKGIRTAKFDTPAAHLWNWTRLAAHEKTVQWTKILRALGYSGAIDLGSKLIHEAEPTQAVFFNINATKVLEVIPNRFKRKPLNKSIGEIKNPNEYVQLSAVQHNGAQIRFIANPSEQLQLIAVQERGSAIKYINNPSEEVQLAAVQEDGTAIEYIIEKGITPSEVIQLAAVIQNGHAIEYIENPSESIKLAAVKSHGSSIKYIDNPSDAVQLAALKKDGEAIFDIFNYKGITPSEAVKKAAGL